MQPKKSTNKNQSIFFSPVAMTTFYALKYMEDSYLPKKTGPFKTNHIIRQIDQINVPKKVGDI